MDHAEISLPLGLPVFSNDGAHLGHVDTVDRERGWFKVRAPQAPDFWLGLDDILDISKRYALLKLRRSQVRARRWEGPEPGSPRASTEGTDWAPGEERRGGRPGR